MQFRLGVIVGVLFAIALVIALLWFSLIRREGPDPVLYPVRGIDVSHHQGEIAWDEVASSGIEFAFIKATEGRDFSDPRFVYNWQQAGEEGVARGAYHFFTFCSPGLDQARHFLSVVPPEPGSLVPVADVEFGGNCTSYEDLETIRRELKIFLVEVERAWGRRPMLYLTVRSMFQIADARFDEYPVWFRNIFWRLPNDGSPLWVVWQHADNGRVEGIVGDVDQNVLHSEIFLQSLRID